MEALRNSTGFFGPSLLADITLVVQILFYLVLCAGVVAQLQQKYKWHDRLQAPIVILNLFFIVFVMLPTFGSVTGSLATQPVQVPTLVTLIHGALGALAQILALYCLLAGFKILPRKIGVLRYWMWAAFSAWTATVIFGIGVYILFYTPVLAAPNTGEVMTEHDADLGEPVEEHAEEAVEPEAPAEPAESAPPESEPGEEIISEHDDEAVIPEPPPTDEPQASPVPSSEEAASPEEPLDEHMADLPEVVEPEFTGEAAPAEWQALESANAGPEPRYNHAIQYSPATNQVYIFGGQNGNQVFNDVWALDTATLTWRQIAANTSPTPPARFSTVMTIDNAGQNLYIATGHTQGGENFGDVWRLNLATESWEELTGVAGPGPEARYGGPGGNLGGNLWLTHGFGSTRYDDTWRFNVETGQWEQVSIQGAVPLRRCLFAATPADTNLVIHGGCASGFGDCFLDDAWILDTQANAWREVLSDVRPAGRQYQTLVADTTNPNQVILFGGQDAGRAARNDLWLLDLATGIWQPVDAPNGPDARYQHAAIWLPNRGMLVYGGRNDSGALGDLWLLSRASAGQPAPAETPTPEPPPPAEPTPTPELISEHEGE